MSFDSLAPGPSAGASVRRTLRALAAVQSALARLRTVDDAAEMLRLAPVETCTTLGFARAAIYRVRGDELVIESAAAPGMPERAEELLGEPPTPLAELPLESEMIRRRDPLLRARALPGAAGGSGAGRSLDVGSYASAPVLIEGRVSGFLHADRLGAGDWIDEVDQLTLCAFAEGFGYAFERTVLRKRLRVQLSRAREVMGSTGQLVDEAVATGIEVGSLERRSQARLAGEPSPEPADPAGPTPAGEPAAALTPRELQVIELIAAGETNARIAERLLISEPTVKSHVRHLLRKLGAAHRAEAVSRYLAGRR